VASVSSISPSTYSPVVKTTLTITISNTYTGGFTRDDFKVYLIPTKSTLSTIAMNVMSVDTSTNQLYVKYPGATSDTYSLKVVSSSYGTLSTSGISFIAIGTITSFTPTTGSIYGGTLLTITGYTFSTTSTDNAV
jgi:IPT/TIG domain